MQRITILLGILLILIVASIATPTTAFAADALYRMLHADEVESFKGDQDAFIVGQLIGKDDYNFFVNIRKVISGSVTADRIWVADFEYGWGATDPTPSVNDYCVMSLRKSGTHYKPAWGVFKADSGDYKTLRLITEDIKFSACKGDISAIEWYVNSGGTENDFSFGGNSTFVHRPNGETIQIYPKQAVEVEPTAAPPEAKQDQTVQRNTALSDSDMNWFLIVVLVAGAAAVLVRLQKK